MLIFCREFDPESYRQTFLRKWKYQIKQVISNRNVLTLGFEGFFRIGIQSVFLTYLILYLQKVFELQVFAARSLFALGHFSGAIGRVIWGLVSDRIFGGERKIVYQFIAFLSGVFFLVLSHLTHVTSFWVIIAVIATLGFTTVGNQGVGQSLIVEVAGKEFAGTASGFTQSFCFLGIVLTAPLFGFILDTFGTYFYSWASLALFSFIAFGLVSLVKEGFKKTL